MAGFGKPLKYFRYYFPIVNDCPNNSYCLFQMLWMRYNTQNASHCKPTNTELQFNSKHKITLFNTKKLFIFVTDNLKAGHSRQNI